MFVHANPTRRCISAAIHRSYSSPQNLTYSQYPFLKRLGIEEVNHGVYNGKWFGSGKETYSVNPSNNQRVAKVIQGNVEDYGLCAKAMEEAKREWGLAPVPARAEVVRRLAVALREHKEDLGALVSLEMGKISAEGLGEVQEAIDICDFAVGLGRQLNGSVIPSERPGHFMMERWNPLLGNLAVLTAFNFPCAVFFWNIALSMVCGNVHIWKPAGTTPLVSIACTKIVGDVLREAGWSPAISSLICGPGSSVGNAIVEDHKNELISFTGSTPVGRNVSRVVSERFGKTILELGGNNALFVMDDADMELALRAVVFSAVGTAGQRCTSLRRLYLHSSIHDAFLEKLVTAYKSVKIGDPLASGILCGPLHTPSAVKEYTDGLEEIKKHKGSKVVFGGKVLDGPSKEYPHVIAGGNFVVPTLVSTQHSAPFIQSELFVPILSVMPFDNLEDAIRKNNDVPQGLSSSIFTTNQAAIFHWTGPAGSDCGIVNVNIGPSGAEIGGAFGGEKETGNGRESGSDSWKQYCKRSTCTINYSKNLPLAQGINFE